MQVLIHTITAFMLLFVFCITEAAAEETYIKSIDITSFLNKIFPESTTRPAIRKKTNQTTKKPSYTREIKAAASYYSIDPKLIRAIITHESNYNRWAQSKKGAMGLMQIMPATAQELGLNNPWNPRENIFAGTRYYRWLLNLYDGNHQIALLAYNTGPGNIHNGKVPGASRVYARKVIKTWKRLRNN